MTATERAEKRAARKASDARIAEARAETAEAVRTGKCPACGQGVHANLAISGWIQCDGYGSDGFRKNGAVPCRGGWQGFTR